MKGLVIGGGADGILVRQKDGETIELGELLVASEGNASYIMQVTDLAYGSQLTQQHLELVSGLMLEEDKTLDLLDRKLRAYMLATLRPLVRVEKGITTLAKSLPPILGNVRGITPEDIPLLAPNDPLRLGMLRSGSKEIAVPVALPGKATLSHHILISATTGKGKSNLASFVLWNSLDSPWCGILVLDPHDEYYGRNGIGLRDHPAADKLLYFTARDPPPGGRTLQIRMDQIRPWHFDGIMPWSDAQREALMAFFKRYNQDWIAAALTDAPVEGFQEGTLGVVKRRLAHVLDVDVVEGQVVSEGPFDVNHGGTTVQDIASALDSGKTVIIDTSPFSGATELLIGSVVAHKVFGNHRHHKAAGTLNELPVVAIVLEEAPRVIGKDVLERGPNIFGTLAREGRKFSVGLVAITQLPSLIPREVLANINTKIIMGTEMKPERDALIDSAAHDLRKDERQIAALDKGEAIVTSTFARFALPIKIPLFADIVKSTPKPKRSFPGVTA